MLAVIDDATDLQRAFAEPIHLERVARHRAFGELSNDFVFFHSCIG